MPIVLKSGSLNLLEPSGPVQTFNGIALPSPFEHVSGTCGHTRKGFANHVVCELTPQPKIVSKDRVLLGDSGAGESVNTVTTRKADTMPASGYGIRDICRVYPPENLSAHSAVLT